MTSATGNRGGVTLIELTVALAMLALAMAITWPRWNEVRDRGTGAALRQRETERKRRAWLSEEGSSDAN